MCPVKSVNHVPGCTTRKSDAKNRDGGNPAAEARDSGDRGATEQAILRGRLLLSWDEILEVLGLPKERKEEVRIKRLNENHSGPIVYVSNKPKVFSEVLLGWIDGLGKEAEGVDDDGADANLELNHPAEMKQLGFQPKVRPNNPGSSAHKSGYEES